MTTETPKLKTVFGKWIEPLTGLVQQNHSKRKCNTVTDQNWIETGLLRILSDSGIIGTKEFVSTLYQQFKNLFQAKREKIPKPIKGLSGVYSLKRLSEVL